MIHLDLVDNEFIITARPVERDLVMKVNGVRAHGSGEWRAPATWPISVDLAFTSKEDGWTVADAVKQWGAVRLAEVQKRIAAKQLPDTDLQGTLGEIELYPGQISDANWLADPGKAFVFSDMRSGKTFTLLQTIEQLDAFPALLAVPTSITFEWRNSLAAAFPNRPMTILTKGMTQAERKKLLKTPGDIIVIPHNLLPKHSKVLTYGGLSTKQRTSENKSRAYGSKELNDIPFKAVVVDEGHILRNHLSQQTRALWALGDQAAQRYVATATPVASERGITGVSIEELWPLLRFLYPESFPARSKFLGTYVEMQPNYFGIMEFFGLKQSRAEAWNLIFQPMFIKRSRANQVKSDIRLIPVELNKAQRKLYNQMEVDSLAEIEGELLFAAEALTARTRLMQLCYGVPIVRDNKVKEIIGPSDIADALFEWLNETDEKTVIFADSVPFFNYLQDQLLEKQIPHLTWPGGLTDVQKTQLQEQFKTGESRILLASLRAVAVGIDFSTATRMAFATLSDDFLALDQSAGRNLGPTQQKTSVEVAYFIAKDTVQERIYERAMSKKQNIKDVTAC